MDLWLPIDLSGERTLEAGRTGAKKAPIGKPGPDA